jgi:hypothetical protein
MKYQLLKGKLTENEVAIKANHQTQGSAHESQKVHDSL